MQIPSAHLRFLENAKDILKEDQRIICVGVAGSYISNKMDEFSDLDFKIIVKSENYDEVMNERKKIASNLGDLVGAFTGEHIGEPSVLICLYDNPILHIDLNFLMKSDLHERVENPVILFDKSNLIEHEINKDSPSYPTPDLQWIEERFWIWIHYMATKIGRGEILEAINHLSFIRSRVLGPLSLLEAGEQPKGLRKIELLAPERANELKETIPEYSVKSCFHCIENSIRIYRSLRDNIKYHQFVPNIRAEQVSVSYLEEIKKRCLE